jgi:hypothetical protein
MSWKDDDLAESISPRLKAQRTREVGYARAQIYLACERLGPHMAVLVLNDALREALDRLRSIPNDPERPLVRRFQERGTTEALSRQRRWRAVSSYDRDVHQRGASHAAAWLIRMDARHDRCCRAPRIIQVLI